MRLSFSLSMNYIINVKWKLMYEYLDLFCWCGVPWLLVWGRVWLWLQTRVSYCRNPKLGENNPTHLPTTRWGEGGLGSKGKIMHILKPLLSNIGRVVSKDFWSGIFSWQKSTWNPDFEGTKGLIFSSIPENIDICAIPSHDTLRGDSLRVVLMAQRFNSRYHNWRETQKAKIIVKFLRQDWLPGVN